MSIFKKQIIWILDIITLNILIVENKLTSFLIKKYIVISKMKSD